MATVISVSCSLCGSVFSRTLKQVNQVVKRSGTWACKPCANTAKNIARAKPVGSRRINNKGYVMVKTKRGYEREHVLVAESKLGRGLLTGEAVHHINGVKTDNDPSNIAVMSHGEHSALHNRQRSQQYGDNNGFCQPV